MFPLAAAELGEAFGLERVLRHGFVLLVWTSETTRAVKRQSGEVAAHGHGLPCDFGGHSSK